MAENSRESVVFIASGAAAGAGVSAKVDGMRLAGSFGAVGIGIAPVTVAGAVAGAADYGAFKAIARQRLRVEEAIAHHEGFRAIITRYLIVA